MANLNTVAACRILEDEDASAFVLMAILLDRYGDEVFEEDPEALFKNIEEDFRCKLPEENENRINAAILSMATDLPYHKPNVFKAVALAFTEGDIGDIPDGEDEELDGSAAIWTVAELGLLNDDPPGDEAISLYSEAVQNLVGELIREQAADEEEIPDSVDTMEEALDTPYFIVRVEEEIKAIAAQLNELGAPATAIQEILDTFGVSME